MMESKPTSVLVTGGLGFIGSTLTEQLLASGVDVTVIDSKISNVIDGSDLLSQYANFHLIEASVSPKSLAAAAEFQPDMVVHLASYVGPAGILKYSGKIGPEIVANTADVIEFSLSHQLPLVYFSSAEVYGFSGVLRESAKIEVTPHYNARIEYALGKVTCESMVYNSRVHGLKSITIRPFNVAGSRQSSAGGFVLPTFIEQALQNQPLTVFHTGQQQRAFTDVRDVAHFVEQVMMRPDCMDGRVVNVGNPGNSITMMALAERVKAQLHSESDIQLVDGKSIHGDLYEEAESIIKIPDIDRARSMGWVPEYDLEAVIEQAAAEIRSKLGSSLESTLAS